MNYDKIESVCESKGLTLGGLAAKIGVTRAGFYRMIEQKSMKVETLEKIAEALEVPITIFFEGVDNYSPEVVNELSAELQSLYTFLFESFSLISVIQHKINKAAKNADPIDESIFEDIDELSQKFVEALQPPNLKASIMIYGDTGKLKDRLSKGRFNVKDLENQDPVSEQLSIHRLKKDKKDVEKSE